MVHDRDEIERYVGEGLPAGREAGLRAHLTECAECRGYYERQLELLRALRGAPDEPTPGEEAALRRRVLAGLDDAPGVGWAQRWYDWLDRYIIVRDRPRVAAGLVAACLLVVGVVVLIIAVPARPVGRIARAEVALLAGQPVANGKPIRTGQRLEVARSGLAVVELEETGTVRVFSGSELSFVGNERRLELAVGKIWCLVDPGANGFQVQTHEAVARVVGTSFVVERRGETTEVRVMEGRVEVEDAQGHGEVEVAAHRRTRVAAGAAPEKPRRYSSGADRDEWESSVHRLLKQLERDLSNGIDTLRNVLP